MNGIVVRTPDDHTARTESVVTVQRAIGISRGRVLAVLTLTALLSSLDRQVLGMLIEPIRLEFDLTDTQLGLLSGPAFYALQAGLGLPLAMLAERTSRRAVISIALATFSAMTAACGLALNFFQLLLARMGVAIGEAGTGPSSFAILADLYPRHELTRAMSIFLLSGTVGGFIAYLIGGFFSQWFGWRVTFLTLGIPGVFLAIICFAVLRGTGRPLLVHGQPKTPPPSLLKTVAFLMSQKTAVRIVAGYAIWTSVNAGITIWIPAFVTRVFEVPQGTLGLMMAVIIGIGGGAGLYIMGLLAPQFERRDARSILWLVVITTTLSIPLAWTAFLIDTGSIAIACGFVTAFMTIATMGPVASLSQHLMPPPMRSVASALTSLIVTAVGASSGPLLIGVMSDALLDQFGGEGLRYALAAMVSFWALAAFLFWSASRSLNADLARVDKWTSADLPQQKIRGEIPEAL